MDRDKKAKAKNKGLVNETPREEETFSVSHEEVAVEFRPVGRSGETVKVKLPVGGKKQSKDMSLEDIR